MSVTLTQSVAAEVRAEMARQRIPQRAIATAMGLSQQAASRRLTGEVPFDTQELEAIAAHLHVPVIQFLEHKGAAAA
jgi:transcriptional regulator with XRE-family HTH domain